MWKVSVLIPIYNVEKYFRRCIVSLFEQDFDSIEYVFVNDASTDRSLDLLQETLEDYPNRKCAVKIISHNTNMGLAVARRTAIENATSEYIIHIDSDDYIDQDMISKMYKIVSISKCDIVLSNTLIEYKNSKIRVEANSVNDKVTYLYEILTRRALFTIWGKLLKRCIVVDNYVYPMPNVDNGEDYQVYPRIVYYANKIEKVNATYYYNKQNQNSYTNSITHKGICDTIISQKILNNFFLSENRINSQVIEESNVMTKISLLSIASFKDYAFISSIFEESDYQGYNVKYLYRMLLYLVDCGFYRLTYCIIYIYKLIFWNNR